VLFPTLLYLPVLLVRGNAGNILQATFPEMRALVLVVSVLVTMLIDATVYTSVTTYYLFQKEQA
jgi:hypothetical protein